jgi:DNA-binding transcriptional regulator YhcF (GntR family)
LNLLNIISTYGQRSADWVWKHSPQDVKGHIIRCIAGHVCDPTGEKVIYIKMRQLAQEVNDSRLDVSRALNEMESEGLIKLLRGRFVIPEMKMLINGKHAVPNKS